MIANPFDYSNIKKSKSLFKENSKPSPTKSRNKNFNLKSHPKFSELKVQLKNVQDENERLKAQLRDIQDENESLKAQLRDIQYENEKLKELLSYYTAQDPEEYLSELTSPIFKNLSEINLTLRQENEDYRKAQEADQSKIVELSQENTNLRMSVLNLKKDKRKSSLDIFFCQDFLEELDSLLSDSTDQVIIGEALLEELKTALALALNKTRDILAPSEEDRESISHLLKSRKSIEEEKKDYNDQENKKISQLKSELNQADFQKLHQEQSQKYQQDKLYQEKIHQLSEEIEEIETRKITSRKEKILEAIDNTIKETKRQNDRDSRTSSTPPSQQGLNRPNTDSGETGKKRGAPCGKNGYRFDFNGLDLSKAEEEKIQELMQQFPVETVELKPEDYPQQAELRKKSHRIVFGMIKSPCIIIYNQFEAVWKDPGNARKRLKVAAPYPEWLKKSFSYSPDYHTEALTLRMQLHSSYSNIARYFNESYGFPVTAKTVWNWVDGIAQDAQEIADKIREALTREEYLGVDETGIRDMGLTRWLYSTVSDQWTYFNVSERRDFKGLEDSGILLNAAEGTVVCRDGYSIYNDKRLKHLIFNRCWAHKNREAEQILTFEDPSNQAVLKLGEWFRQALEEREKALEQGKSRLNPEVFNRLSQSFDSIVEEGLKNSEPTKILFKPKTRHLLIRNQMKKLLAQKENFWDFLKEGPPYTTPWEGYQLSGKKNPQAVVDLFEILNQIDLAVALANRDNRKLSPSKQEALEKTFWDQVEKIYEEFRDSKAQMNIQTPPQLSYETTQVYKFFRDLQRDHYAFLNFIRDLNSKVSNNDTERAIREIKTVMKVVGSFRGYSQEYANLESYISSAKKQNLNLQTALSELVSGNTNFLFDQKQTVSKSKRGTIKTVPVKNNS